jgi:hypothetical protein
MNGLLALAALAYALPLDFLFETAIASRIEKFALYAAGLGAVIHLLRRKSPLQARPEPAFAWLLVLAWLWTGLWFSAWCFDGLILGAYDYTGMSSVIASWHQNAGLLSSPYYTSANGSEFYLAHHFSPVLLFFVPLYAIASTHAFYGVLLQLCFAGGLLVCYRMARAFSPLPLLVFSALLFMPSVYRLGVSFHFELLALPFAGLMLLGVKERNTRMTTAGFLLLLLLKEDQAVFAGLFGISLLFDRERRKTGAVIALVSAAVFIFVTRFYLPQESGEEHSRFLSYWGAASLKELIFNTGPLQVWDAWQKGWEMPAALLLSAGLFPLLRPALALIVLFPIFTLHLLSSHPFFHGADAYYMYTYLPYLLYGALDGMNTARRLTERFFTPARSAAFFACILFAFAAYQARARKDVPFPVMPDRAAGIALREFLKQHLEPGKSVQTHAFLSAQVPLANRVYSPAHKRSPDYILFEPGRSAAQDETPTDLERMAESCPDWTACGRARQNQALRT